MSSILDLSKRWYDRQLPLRTCSLKEVANSTTSKDEMDALFREAQEVLDAETAQSQHEKGRWYNTQFLSRGTTTDKIASAAVKLSDTDFMFFLDGFNLLFDTARTDTHHYEAALKALTVIWPKLLPRRPLKRFVSQFFATLPIDKSDRQTVLVYWYIEDYLKRTYAQFLSLAEAMLKDRLLQRREAWLGVVGKLMCSVAEGRHVAMSLIVDKLGDPNSRVAHKAYHHLLDLLSESSTHQSTLFVELEKVIFMKNCPVSTMKYAANVMNQFVYTKDERKLALKGVQTYLALFRFLVVNSSVDLSVTTAVLVGLRRAFPYAGADTAPIEEHLNALFALANTGTFMQRVATLSLLQLIAQGKTATDALRNRWYRALYNVLLISPKQLPQSAQLTGFFSMLHKALRGDRNEERVAAFAHRLLQRALYFSDAMICAILLLVGEMAQAHPSVRALIRSPRASLAASKGILGADKAKLKGETENTGTQERYDVKHRDPQFACATRECLWTLNLLSRHSHPSVVKLAVMLMFEDDVVFDSHPLDELTLPNFLQMFVDAKAQPKDSDKAPGMSVFRRVVHAPNVPSASDPYFLNASAQQVDVSALFLHRYAVQRKRFIDGLSQVRSTWGSASGEADVALRVADIDASLFGPSGALSEHKAAKSKKKNTKPTNPKEEKEEKEEEKEDSEEDNDGDYDEAPGSDGDLEWGNDNILDEDEDDDEDDEDDEDNEDDDDDDENGANGDVLGRSGGGGGGEADGEDLAQLLESHRRVVAKRQRRADEWMERRAAETAAPQRQKMRR